MGSGASSQFVINENKRIYKYLDCGCICSLVYKNNHCKDIELLAPCYNCLENLKNNKYDSEKISKLYKKFSIFEMNELIDKNIPDRWLIES